MKFNLRKIMLKAWELYRKGRLTFAECLHRSRLSAKAEQGAFRLLSDLGHKGRRRNISGAILRRVASPAGHGVRG